MCIHEFVSRVGAWRGGRERIESEGEEKLVGEKTICLEQQEQRAESSRFDSDVIVP